ncbi:M48 family metalloprotease [Candidatus Peribacteria bacterium]|nr:M48 family metalloprotease [Candidatus Peribacteria bacterium]
MRLLSLENIMSAHPSEKIVYQTVEHIAQKNGITLPEVGIYDSSEVNAFATGATRNASLVAVSSGLIAQMNPEEIEGVVAHEMAHILNGDMVTMTLLQ